MSINPNSPKHILRSLSGNRLRNLLISKKGWGIAFIGIAFAILFWMIYKERETLFQYHWEFRVEFLVLFAVFHLLALLATTWVWHLAMTRLTGVKRARLDFGIYSISLVSRRIPGTLWYIGSRFALYPAELVPSKIITIVTGLELGLVGLAGIICYTLFVPFYSFSYNWPWQIFVGAGAFALLLFIIKPGIVIEVINLLLKTLKRTPVTASIYRADLMTWLFLYLVGWALDGVSLYFWIKSVIQVTPGVMDAVGVSAISGLVSYVAQFLPSGFALKEISMSAMLSLWIPVSVGLVVALGYRIGMLLVEIAMAVAIRTFFFQKTSDQGEKQTASID